jgi:predicted transcriptional regulator
MEIKKRILLLVQSKPGIKSSEMDLGIKNSALGMHLRSLSLRGDIVKTQAGGWQISNNFVMEDPLHFLSPMDVAAKYIREMINLRVSK